MKQLEWSWRNERRMVVAILVTAVVVVALWGLIVVPLWVSAGMPVYLTILNVGLFSYNMYITYRLYKDLSRYPKWG